MAVLNGSGTGKSVLGARWPIVTAIVYPERHFLAMGQVFAEALPPV